MSDPVGGFAVLEADAGMGAGLAENPGVDVGKPLGVEHRVKPRIMGLADQHEAVDPALDQFPDLGHLAGQVVFGHGQQEGVAILAEALLKRPDSARENGVVKSWYNGPHGLRAVAGQGARRAMRHVAQPADGRMNAFGQIRTNLARIVERPRDGCRRNLRFQRDIQQTDRVPRPILQALSLPLLPHGHSLPLNPNRRNRKNYL